MNTKRLNTDKSQFDSKPSTTKQSDNKPEYSLFKNMLLKDETKKKSKEADLHKKKHKKTDKKVSKSKERHKRKSTNQEDYDISTKIQNIRMTSPTFEKPEPLNINTTDEVSSNMKQTGTFLSPFESSKGRNKSEKFSKSQTRQKRKSQPR